MPVLVPTPDELNAMPQDKRDEWLTRLPAREVIKEVVRKVYEPSIRNLGVVVDERRHRRGGLRDADVVRCPLCGAWTIGVCRTGHGEAS